MDIVDFHTHTFLSDGVLGPGELIRRAQVKGYTAIGITDHCDETTLDFLLKKMIELKNVSKHYPITVIPGVELTHVLPKKIKPLTKKVRDCGIPLVIVHGETPVEPVIPGTNLAAIAAGVDILAHPGAISPAAARLAKKNRVCLELTARGGHSLYNGYVAGLISRFDCPFVCSSDGHRPDDLMTAEKYRLVLEGSGLTGAQRKLCERHSRELLQRCLKRLFS